MATSFVVFIFFLCGDLAVQRQQLTEGTKVVLLKCFVFVYVLTKIRLLLRNIANLDLMKAWDEGVAVTSIKYYFVWCDAGP